jgi:hypothetical protein
MQSEVSMKKTLFLAAGLLGACVSGSSSLEQRDDVHGGEACKLEGAGIGQVGATATVHGTTVTFLSWTPKADSPGEYVGFTLSPEGASMDYVVKAGTELYAGSGYEWIHPEGDSGPAAHGISNVDFCDDEPCDDYPDAGAGAPIP